MIFAPVTNEDIQVYNDTSEETSEFLRKLIKLLRITRRITRTDERKFLENYTANSIAYIIETSNITSYIAVAKIIEKAEELNKSFEANALRHPPNFNW